MRRMVATAAALAVAALCVAASSPAVAARGPDHRYEAYAPYPCSALCPYWTDFDIQTQWDTACRAEPLTVPGSYHDLGITVPAEDGGVIPKLITWTVRPVVDYDIVVCHAGPDGRANGKAAGLSVCSCDVLCTHEMFGCVEEDSQPVRPGERYVLRAYNWSDLFPAPAVYYYSG